MAGATGRKGTLDDVTSSEERAAAALAVVKERRFISMLLSLSSLLGFC